ncbi:MAG: Na+/H+ antiporter NhaA [Rhodobacteraceae bacterium]|nr:Na+/H+ antiporter NhaA [Paracoccaceae bacterium]MCF8516358.1 Na+/H+ antiporter NhaA [Paracoccaceae bacterium]MCF8520708.1 Na+/H+ antiporter NhaA [Paracoccaceae bacterium]
MYRVSPFVRHFAWALLGGIGAATLWLNVSPATYYDTMEMRLAEFPLPLWIVSEPLPLTPVSVVSQGLMALFLLFIGKELWESLMLRRGALSGRRAGLPLGAMLGGWLGAVAVWLVTGSWIETALEASSGDGWAVPIGSDVVLCYLIGRRVFGPSHPALHLLLLITIANDIAGLLVLGLAFPQGGLRLSWLLLSALAVGGVWLLFGRLARPGKSERQHLRAFALWPYMVAGALCWAGVVLAGLPGALGLLPLIPAIPHADRAFGLFAEAEEFLQDPLNRLAHLLVKPIAAILFLFGLTSGGIDLQAFAPTSLTVLAAFWVGKPLGVLLGAACAARLLRFALPQGVRPVDLVLVALISGMGFTVPVLTISTALPGGGMQEAARLGLAISLGIGALALLVGPMLRRK